MDSENNTQLANILSLPASIPPTNLAARSGFQLLCRLAPTPHGAPCVLAATIGIRTCLAAVFQTIHSPNNAAKEIDSNLSALQSVLQEMLHSADAREAFTSLRGTKGRHPEWSIMVAHGQRNQGHKLARLYVGLKSLLAIKDKKSLSQAATTRAAELLQVHDLSEAQIMALITGSTPDTALGQSWTRDLCRAWRDVVRAYSNDPTPPVDPKSRFVSQMLDASLNATAQRRGGARTHRQMSSLQLNQTHRFLGQQIESGTLIGTLGVLVSISTFSVDLVAHTPLSHYALDANCAVEIDIVNGMLKVDYSLVYDQSALPIEGAIASSYICSRQLPANVAESLRARSKEYPNARTLLELFPNEIVPNYDQVVYSCTDQIQPTWSRLRRSTGVFLRENGIDNLTSSVISGDHTHVPRSKLFYACISSEEISHGLVRLYALAGWSPPAPAPTNTMAFGCRVVPTNSSLVALDSHWAEKVQRHRPGKNSTLEHILEFHNHFICWTGERLSLLLALRESAEIRLSASVYEEQDRWIPIHDKKVPGDQGPLPVPLTQCTKNVIQHLRLHCRSLEARLLKKGMRHCDLARWCRAVLDHADVPLLCVASSTHTIRPLATSDFICGDLIKSLLPPDFGRKAMENLLRAQGLHATEIDAFLRHSVQGQSRNSATSDASSSAWWRRTDVAVSRISTSIFSTDFYGLCKE